MSYNCVPGGYESEDSDGDYYDGYYFGKTTVAPQVVIKSPIELKKEKLLECLNENDVNGMREELDNGEVKGFDIDDVVDGYWSLLFHACNLALPDIVKFLINERGASINLTINSETPLMVTCYSSKVSEAVMEVAKALIKKSTIVSSSNLLGITPLMFASLHGHTNVVSYLLALNDSYDAIDNEGKNALFHAIDGGHVEIAKLLIETGIDLGVVNKFGYTAKDYAKNEMQEKIYELFPAEIQVYQAPGNFLSYNRFEDLIPGLAEIPDYFPDIVAMLRGMNGDRFINKFAEARVNLFEFLTMTDARLKEIGIEFKFERNIILMGLHKFHNEPWSQKSLFIPRNFKDELTDLDLMAMLANVLRQLVVIESQLVYMERLGEKFKIQKAFQHLEVKFVEDFKRNVDGLAKLMAKKKLKRPLMIKKKKSSIFGTFKIAIIGLVPIVIFVAFKFIQN